MNRGNVIQKMNVFDVIYRVGKANKKSQAVLLNSVEEVLGKDSEEYKQVRKLFLDNFNKYTRTIVSIVFGSDYNI